VTTTTINQVLWLRKIWIDLHVKEREGSEVFVNNQGAIVISDLDPFMLDTTHQKQSK